MQALFQTEVQVAPEITVIPYTSADVYAAVGRIVDAPPRSITVVGVCGSVLAVKVLPMLQPDPVLPVLWRDIPSHYVTAARCFWKALNSALSGRSYGPARRWAQVVLATVRHLNGEERAFFEAYLWGSFNGEATNA